MIDRLLLTDDANGEVRELTGADFKLMRPASDVLPEIFGAEPTTEMLKPKGGRPRTNTPKVFTGIRRLDPDVLETFRATGKDWQTRMNNALKE